MKNFDSAKPDSSFDVWSTLHKLIDSCCQWTKLSILKLSPSTHYDLASLKVRFSIYLVPQSIVPMKTWVLMRHVTGFYPALNIIFELATVFFSIHCRMVLNFIKHFPLFVSLQMFQGVADVIDKKKFCRRRAKRFIEAMYIQIWCQNCSLGFQNCFKIVINEACIIKVL